MTTSRTHRIRTSRKALASALVSAALVASVSACSPIETNKPYAASDGIRTTVGDVSVVNFFVVSNEDGSKARVLGALTNTSRDVVTFTVTIPADGGSSRQFLVQPGQTYNLNDEDNATYVTDLGVKPGAVVDTTMESGGTDASVQIPVLDGTLPAYQDYVPGA